MKDEALRLALEALEFDGFTPEDATHRSYHAKAITAIKQALEQPEHSCIACEGNPKGKNNPCNVCGLAQPEPEPVAIAEGKELYWISGREPIDDDDRFLYTSPQQAEGEAPKREWQGLTDDERRGLREWQKIQEELGPVWAPMMLYLYEAIEAKLKEKNT